MNENMEQIAPVEQTTEMGQHRDPNIIVAEIRLYSTSALANLVEAGRRLCELKDTVPHGEFGQWVEASGHSKSSANNLMRLFEAYGSPQGSLFGAEVANAQAFGSLNYTKALALLALPSEADRVEFMETHDVENMTTRELKKAIKERDDALAERDAARKDEEAAKKTIAYVSNQAKKDRDEAQQKADALTEQIRTLEEHNTEIETNALNLSNERDDLLARVKELESAAPNAAEPDKEAIDKAVSEAVEKANAAHAAELEKLKAGEEKKRKALEKKVADAEKAAKDAEEKAADAGKTATGEADELRTEAKKLKEEADDLRRQLAMSGETVVTFKLFFTIWQNDYSKMLAALAKADAETETKLRAAIKKQMEGWLNA